MQQRFTELVLEELVDPKDGVSLYNMAHPRGTGLGGVTPVRSSVAFNNTNAVGTVTLPSGSITLGETTLSEAGLKQMLKAHSEMKKPKRWWNKSIPELLGANK